MDLPVSISLFESIPLIRSKPFCCREGGQSCHRICRGIRDARLGFLENSITAINISSQNCSRLFELFREWVASIR